MSHEKIELKVDAGPIVFLGSMNAMPMMYAFELRKLGYEVIYFVDSAPEEHLNRPENHFSDIAYPYPDWIVEFDVASQMLLPFFRKTFSRLIEKKISALSQFEPQGYITNGFFSSILPYLPNECFKVALSHGSDLDTWGDLHGVSKLQESFKKQSIYKFLPGFISRKMISEVVSRQYFGFLSSDAVVYFPKGFNSAGDSVISSLEASGVRYVSRHDISFEPLKKERRGLRCASDKIVIFSGVRFNYKTFYDGNSEYNKGNDIIINGISAFYEENKNIEVHFVRKGPDVCEAVELCDQLGMSDIVIWHDEMKFYELLKLYRMSDICFDQVGEHWPGAIGCYALWLGKPLITNDSRLTASGVWPKENPVCTAENPMQIKCWLDRLKSAHLRRKISRESMSFADNYLGPEKTLNEIFLLKNSNV